MNIEVRDLRLVRAVVETGSLAKASEELHVTPSALSHQLRRLEGLLEARLFSRNDRGMRPTPAGERLFDSARVVLAQLTEAEHAIRLGARPAGARLRLAMECHTWYDLLPAVLGCLRKRHPTVEVNIDTQAVEQPLQKVAAGELDVAIVTSLAPTRSTSLSYSMLVDELVALLPSDHPLADRRCIEPGDLTPENVFLWISPEQSPPTAHVLKQAGPIATAVTVVPYTPAAVAFVGARMGVAILPKRTARLHMNHGRLRMLPIGAAGLRQHWSVVTSGRVAPSTHVQEFVRLLGEQARQHDAPRVVKLRGVRSERLRTACETV